MKKKKKYKKQVKMGKFERLLYTFTIILVLSCPFVIVFSQATLSKINYEVEKSKKEITSQQKKNESITMKINELASLDKIQEVADSEGLSYNNDNIKTIVDE
ncbi:MAG: cell division protein FtsL [bacterium]|nr:cell division protein FtsL [bacterium]